MPSLPKTGRSSLFGEVANIGKSGVESHLESRVGGRQIERTRVVGGQRCPLGQGGVCHFGDRCRRD